MPDVIEWRQGADAAIIARAARALAEGQLVVFPTETVYGIAASVQSPAGIEKLVTCKGRPETKPFPLAIPNADAVRDWLPRLGVVGTRLANRCWPGPITLVSGDGLNEGRSQQLAEPVRRKVCPTGTIGLRVPAHDAILKVLSALSAPLALTSANRSDEPDAVSAEEAVRSVGQNVDLVIADGTCRFGKPSTVVQITNGAWRVLREGSMSLASVQRMASCVIVFVCTGNTCRSPLAEALFTKMLAERLGCTAEDLQNRGYTVRSAGLSALAGAPATDDAVAVAEEMGADLSRHMSRPLTTELAAQADYLVVMTQSHLWSLSHTGAKLGAEPRLLCPEGKDIPDPIGSDRETYQDCASKIRRSLEPLLAEVDAK